MQIPRQICSVGDLSEVSDLLGVVCCFWPRLAMKGRTLSVWAPARLALHLCSHRSKGLMSSCRCECSTDRQPAKRLLLRLTSAATPLNRCRLVGCDLKVKRGSLQSWAEPTLLFARPDSGQ